MSKKLKGDEKMTEYAAVKDGAIVKLGDFDAKPPDIPHKGIAWLPVNRSAAPQYDPATQVLLGPTTSILPDQVSVSYSVRQKTAQELDDDKVDAVSSIGSVVLKVLFNHESRLRVLESKPSITFQQFLVALKGLL